MTQASNCRLFGDPAFDQGGFEYFGKRIGRNVSRCGARGKQPRTRPVTFPILSELTHGPYLFGSMLVRSQERFTEMTIHEDSDSE